MTTGRFPFPARLTGTVAVLGLALTGCSGLLGIEATERPDSCRWLADIDGRRSPSATDLVVLVDRSASVQTRDERRAPNWYAVVFGDEQVTAKDGVLSFNHRRLPTPANVHVGAFDGGGRVDWQDPVSLPRLEGESRFATEFVDHVTTCVKRRVDAAATSASRTRGTDVLAAMTAGARMAVPDARTREMVVATDGLVTEGCADLSRTAMRDQQLIARITRSCARQHGTPGLRGWRVTLSGVGSPGEGWPVPRTGRLGWLTGLWSSLCASATQDPDRCRVDTRQPRAGRRAAEPGVADVPLRFPQDETAVNPVVTQDFPDGVLFDTGSADVRPDGSRLIRRFVDDITATAPEWVRVLGHTDSRGGTAANEGLSQRRAEAVARELRDAGLTGVTAEGLGETRPACSEKGLRGAELAAAQSCNRRVEIRYKVRG